VQTVGSQLVLFGYDKASQRTDTYALCEKSPWLEPIENRLSLGGPWDAIEAFQIGNCPHLMCYQSKSGELDFVPVSDMLESAPALKYSHPREPLTSGFTTVAMLSALGQVCFFGYNGENGDVNLYTLSVTATSSAKQPPLVGHNVWSWQWAKGWTRFAFFTFSIASERIRSSWSVFFIAFPTFHRQPGGPSVQGRPRRAVPSYSAPSGHTWRQSVVAGSSLRR